MGRLKIVTTWQFINYCCVTICGLNECKRFQILTAVQKYNIYSRVSCQTKKKKKLFFQMIANILFVIGGGNGSNKMKFIFNFNIFLFFITFYDIKGKRVKEIPLKYNKSRMIPHYVWTQNNYSPTIMGEGAWHNGSTQVFEIFLN